MTLFGLAYMPPIIVFGTYKTIYEASSGQVTLSYAISLLAMLLTACSYALMAHHHPVSGSSYSYAVRAFGERIGFLVGWTILLDYLFLPMMIWLLGAIYLQDVIPSIPKWAWIVCFIVLTSALNIIGLNVAKKVNLLLMGLQIAVIIAFCFLLFAFCLLAWVLYQNQLDGKTVSIVKTAANPVNWGLAFAGGAIACYSFLGFDAISTMAEETFAPKRTVPKAILIATVVAGLIYVLTSYALSQSFPDFSVFQSETAVSEISQQVGGIIFSSLFIATLIIAQFTSGLSAQATVSRLLYVMGRDGVFPQRIFANLHPNFNTPYIGLIIVGVVGLLAIFMDLSTSISFVNFGAFISFMVVNLCVIKFFIHLPNQGLKQVVFYLVVPILGFLSVGYLLISLDAHAIKLGSIWLFLGLIYLVLLSTK